MGIGRLMEDNVQLQELTEKVMSMAFTHMMMGIDFTLEELCDDLGLSESEVMWSFEQLGYTITFVKEEGESFIDDEEKMIDFNRMSREEFLSTYPHLTEEDYDATLEEYNEIKSAYTEE